MYSVPESNNICANCKYREYDTFHNELWCSHKPKPEGIGDRLIIDNYGTCEYFKDWEE